MNEPATKAMLLAVIEGKVPVAEATHAENATSAESATRAEIADTATNATSAEEAVTASEAIKLKNSYVHVIHTRYVSKSIANKLMLDCYAYYFSPTDEENTHFTAPIYGDLLLPCYGVVNTSIGMSNFEFGSYTLIHSARISSGGAVIARTIDESTGEFREIKFQLDVDGTGIERKTNYFVLSYNPNVPSIETVKTYKQEINDP